jgi:Tetratricopeptide repeat
LEHPSTLSSNSYLATTLLYQEKYEEGARMHRQAFELRLKVLGRDHADTLASLQKLAEVLLFLGRNDEVEEAASMVLPSELLSVDAESTGEGVDPKEESFVMSAPTQGDEEMVAESGLSPDHILPE